MRHGLSLYGFIFAILLSGCTGGGARPQITSITFASNAQGTDIVCTTSSVSATASGAPVCTSSLLPTVVTGGSSIYIFADVANDDELLGVTWAVSCSSSSPPNLQSSNTACGTFSPVQTESGPVPLYQTTGIVTTYNAPSAVPKGGTVTITAAATSQPTVTLSVTLPAVSGTQSKFETPMSGAGSDTHSGPRIAALTKLAMSHEAGSGI
ncbi:MAG TPA: hypothetical protein VL986_07160 [Terracidiphilus sp.]|nr:hypothetical protein [Terracidiphilus sp.]